MNSIPPEYPKNALCINLKRRPERWLAFSSRATAQGFSFIRRFEAIDGNCLQLPDALRTHAGAYGCLYSHAAVFQQALASGDESMFVTEDDCVFLSTVKAIGNYISATSGDYSWIHLGYGQNRSHDLKNCGTHIEVTQILTTHAYVVDSQLMQAYVDYLEVNPFPSGLNIHADRLLIELCKSNGFKICVPPAPLAKQDRALPRDVQWGFPQSNAPVLP